MESEKYLNQSGAIEQMAKLIIDYIGDYNRQEHPFLLFDLANANENDHTKVLLGILKFNNYMFLPKFLQAIGAPDYLSISECPTDQKPAIGNSGKGFIDLYFEYKSQNNTEKVIIENKIYGAGDTDYQLARYIATVIDPNIDNTKFEEIWKEWDGNKDVQSIPSSNYNNVHVVYLTSDGTKKPEKTSLPNYFRKNEDDDGNFEGNHINYYSINYLENIIPWLENDVLPNMPYSDDGIAIAGVRQYIEYLKTLFYGKGNSQLIIDYVKSLNQSNDVEKYDAILNMMNVVKDLVDKEKRNENEGKNIKALFVELKNKGIDVDDLPELHSLVRELRSEATSIFSNDGADLGEDWKLYFTPSFILLYRQRWADLDTRKYSIPSIYFLTSTDYFLKGKNIKWKMQVDHLNYQNVEKNNINEPFKLGNHDKTAYYEIINIDQGLSVVDSRNVDSRKRYYSDLLGNMEKYIYIVDKVVNEIRNNRPTNKIFQEYALRRIAEELRSKDESKVSDTFVSLENKDID
jgi:hypothetical protein